MPYKGFIIHTSVCPSINGKGFDFWIDASGTVHAAPLLTDPDYIHLCLEGDFGLPSATSAPAESKQQIFGACKLILDLAALYRITPLIVKPHNDFCPGSYFPWNELVLYPGDGYH
ncbi:peptidoglycan recognition protein family protein [Paenibacillus sp. URB8-2]|uniref:peptidoglycan recognition protein family protein n=1 Tax=Paenibacillus sp. URB8-2 TaxID=2741301 RepID=UPI0015B890AA|nr:N-acetylmuramoyl-L-alanine amidase [Paenibacillus sp. URB8-2]BCG59962.1 hypothetical protein PUR_33870 [Paenibacillus sp. URB8-2]